MLDMVFPTSQIFVVDTSAMMGQLQHMTEDIQLATTPLLLQEMLQKASKENIQLLLDMQKLKVLEPSAPSLKEVMKAAKELGDFPYLSQPDQQLLALALDLQNQEYSVVILTDDYSIQNVAQQLSLKYKSISEQGIREVIQWETYCPACKRVFFDHKKQDPCPDCGTPLKRRAKRKN